MTDVTGITRDWGRETVLFEVPLTTGERLALIQSDEDLCIKRDGQLVAGCFWRPSQLTEAVAEFRHLSRQPGEPAGKHQTVS